MRYAGNYLSGIGRSVTRLMPRPAPLRPDLDRLALLRGMTNGAADRSDAADAARAVRYFATRPAAAGFFAVSEAREAVAAYGRHRPAWRRAVLAEARCLCTEGLPVYATLAAPLGGGFDWSSLPLDSHDDRLYRLRPHRFGFLPRLALASCLGADCLPALQATLAGWIRHVETTGGVEDAYFSNLVVIYRLVAVSWAAPLLAAQAAEGDDAAAAACLLLFRILAADCGFLPPQLGRSQPNNHRLADCFAAWFLATCHPELAPSIGEPGRLEQDWHAEFGRQFQADGTNFEQSLHYHELGCEMAVAYLAIVLRRGTPPGGRMLMLIRQALRFQAALAARNGNGFALGDATEDSLLPFGADGAWGRGAWRMLYRALFEPGFPATPETSAGGEAAHWLLATLRGTGRPLAPTAAAEPLGQLAAFPDGGYVAFRHRGGDDCLLFRTGPRRGAAIHPGHVMSDLLSVYWQAEGQAVLQPAGTYSYAALGPPPGGGPLAPRDYFRGPAAHNGPVLRGHDPLGVPRTRFRSGDAGARAATRWQGLDGVAGWAEARLDEAGPLDGWRRGVLRIAGRAILVYDRLPSLPGDVDLACHWQFAPEAAVEVRPRRQVVAARGDLPAYLCASQGVAVIDCATGRQSPPAGWLSRRYGQLEAAPQLICRLAPGTRAVAFAIGRAAGEDLPEVEVATAGEDGLVVVLHRERDRAIAVFGRFCGRAPGCAIDLDVDGEALWLELDGQRCIDIRALGLRRFASGNLDIALSADDPHRRCLGWRQLAGRAGADGLCGRWRAIPRDAPQQRGRP